MQRITKYLKKKKKETFTSVIQKVASLFLEKKFSQKALSTYI